MTLQRACVFLDETEIAWVETNANPAGTNTQRVAAKLRDAIDNQPTAANTKANT